MSIAKLQVLLVEDEPDDADYISATLTAAPIAHFALEIVDSLRAALARLESRTFDAVLLDLNLPDSEGIATLHRARAVCADVPILVHTGLADEALAVLAVHEGAQDYLVKGELDPNALVRALRHAIERNRLVQARLRAEAAAHGAQQALLEQHRNAERIVRGELQKAREELIRTTRLATIGQLSAQIAHDLRNPLGAIRNAIYFLRARPPDPGCLRDYLNLIAGETERCSQFIENMLGAVQSNEPQYTEVDLEAIIRASAHTLPMMGNFELAIELDPKPFLLTADENQLRQVFENLFRNSVEALKTSGRILVTARQMNGAYWLTVSDSGPGIPLSQRATVFEAFQTTKPSGTGLGLAICRQIVERHGGSIHIEESVLGGATIGIRLPQKVNHTERAGKGGALQAGTI